MLLQNIPPRLKRVPTLRCEILMSVKQEQPEEYNVIYNILQGIVAMEFKSGETSDYDYYKFTT